LSGSDRQRDATIIGAAALAITDRAAVPETTDELSTSTVAALSSLHHFLDDATVDDLRRVLGLSHSGAVRLVDRLADAGLARRGPGRDLRSRSVALTKRGTELAVEITNARLEAIDRLTVGLTSGERRTLVGLLGRVLANVVTTKDGERGRVGCAACPPAAASAGFARRRMLRRSDFHPLIDRVGLGPTGEPPATEGWRRRVGHSRRPALRA